MWGRKKGDVQNEGKKGTRNEDREGRREREGVASYILKVSSKGEGL